MHNKYGRAWKRIRDREINYRPWCELCLKEGIFTKATEVHHIVPISAGGTHSSGNLMCLCRACHKKMDKELGLRN